MDRPHKTKEQLDREFWEDVAADMGVSQYLDTKQYLAELRWELDQEQKYENEANGG